MRRFVWLPALAGMLLVAAPASRGQQAVGPLTPYPAAYPASPAARPPIAGVVRVPAAPACGHRPGCNHRHDCSVPCAEFAKPQTKPLPCITLSRYADNGDYDCVRRVYGDGYPHCPRYWFDGQPYPLPHDYSAGGGEGDDSSDAGQGGRGVGVGSSGGSSGSSGGGSSRPSGGRGVGVGGR